MTPLRLLRIPRLRAVASLAGGVAVTSMVAAGVIGGADTRADTATIVRSESIASPPQPALEPFTPPDVTTTTSGMSFRPSVTATVAPPPLD